MEIIGKIFDKRIESLNVLLELTIKEYYDISKNILSNSEFQRKRVKAAASVYSLLKQDLKLGCVIPPLVLGITSRVEEGCSNDSLLQLIEKEKDRMIILDGLQRTYTIHDLLKEMPESAETQSSFLNNKIRVEIYIGINKLGILYRMLTLNTGQTPMSSRHQIEIIYSDYLKLSFPEDIKLIREVDGDSPNIIGEYKFKDVIDGFTSYIHRDYLSLERTDILDNIKSLEKLAIENQTKDLFLDFLRTYDRFIRIMDSLCPGWEYNPEDMEKSLSREPFAHNVVKIFNKSQALTGFGSAVGKLIDQKALEDIPSLEKLFSGISIQVPEDLNTMLNHLDDIRNIAAKIGNDQRLFFSLFFRELFDSKSDGYKNFKNALNEAKTEYDRKTR